MTLKSDVMDGDEVLHNIDPHISEILNLPPTIKVSELLEAIAYEVFLSNKSLNGISGEALRYGQDQWQRGTLHLCIAFYPDPCNLSTNECQPPLSESP
ncbi:MAG: hypothetical protein ACFE0J_11440 [Elainellaceae cyanobacterium]